MLGAEKRLRLTKVRSRTPQFAQAIGRFSLGDGLLRPFSGLKQLLVSLFGLEGFGFECRPVCRHWLDCYHDLVLRLGLVVRPHQSPFLVIGELVNRTSTVPTAFSSKSLLHTPQAPRP